MAFSRLHRFIFRPRQRFHSSARQEIDGSPLIALNTPRGKFQKIYLVEQDPIAFESLKGRIASDKRCVLMNDNCNTAVQKIIKEKDSSALYTAFIDPTGLDIHFTTIQSLASRIKCDLIINWYMSALKRNLSQWQATGESERLDNFFGTDKWKDSLKKSPQSAIFQDFVDLYRRQLQSIGYIHQADPRTVKNTRNAVMYWLWYSSKDSRGLDFWRKAVKSSSDQRKLEFPEA